MTLRSDRHLATLCSSTALLLRGRLVDKAPGARLLIKARALHSDAHRRSRIYGRNRIPHSNLRQVLARLGPYMLEQATSVELRDQRDSSRSKASNLLGFCDISLESRA